jgi:hypothetical protein
LIDLGGNFFCRLKLHVLPQTSPAAPIVSYPALISTPHFSPPLIRFATSKLPPSRLAAQFKQDEEILSLIHHDKHSLSQLSLFPFFSSKNQQKAELNNHNKALE